MARDAFPFLRSHSHSCTRTQLLLYIIFQSLLTHCALSDLDSNSLRDPASWPTIGGSFRATTYNASLGLSDDSSFLSIGHAVHDNSSSPAKKLSPIKASSSIESGDNNEGLLDTSMDIVAKDLEKTQGDLRIRKEKIESIKNTLMREVDGDTKVEANTTSSITHSGTSQDHLENINNGDAEHLRLYGDGSLPEKGNLNLETRSSLPEISTNPSNDEWTNATLSKLTELGKFGKDSSEGKNDRQTDIADAEHETQGTFFARISKWIFNSQDTPKNPSKFSTASQEKIISELKASILEHFKKQQDNERRADAKNKALKLAFDGFTDLEKHINETQNVISNAKLNLATQKQQVDELKEEKNLRDAADELEKAAEALEQGMTYKVDYETGRVTNVEADESTTVNNIGERKSTDVGTEENVGASFFDVKKGDHVGARGTAHEKTKAAHTGTGDILGNGSSIETNENSNSLRNRSFSKAQKAPDESGSLNRKANVDSLSDVEAIAEARLVAAEEKWMKERGKGHLMTALGSAKQNSERVKRVLERARRARRDSDPALIESESVLIIDMAKLMAAAALGGIIARATKMPNILGFIAGGMLCGPSGFNVVHEIRRLQTLASLGGVFMVFALGVDFPVREVFLLRKLVASGAFLGLFAFVIIAGTMLKMSGFAPTVLSAFIVSLGLSVSSTSVALSYLAELNGRNGFNHDGLKHSFTMSSTSANHGNETTATFLHLHGKIVLGMIACSELISALILSVPKFAASFTTTAPTVDLILPPWHNFYFKLCLGIVMILLLLVILGIGPFKYFFRAVDGFICLCIRHILCKSSEMYKTLRFSNRLNKSSSRLSGANHASRTPASSSNQQMLVLTMVAFCLVSSVFTNLAGLSLEMGAFLGGLLVARMTHLGQNIGIQILKVGTPSNPTDQVRNQTYSTTATRQETQADVCSGTPSKTEIPNGKLIGGTDPGLIVGVLSPLRDFFSFLYYATAGMALNPMFMFHNFYSILGFAAVTGLLKTFSFAAALMYFKAPALAAFK